MIERGNSHGAKDHLQLSMLAKDDSLFCQETLS